MPFFQCSPPWKVNPLFARIKNYRVHPAFCLLSVPKGLRFHIGPPFERSSCPYVPPPYSGWGEESVFLCAPPQPRSPFFPPFLISSNPAPLFPPPFFGHLTSIEDAVQIPTLCEPFFFRFTFSRAKWPTLWSPQSVTGRKTVPLRSLFWLCFPLQTSSFHSLPPCHHECPFFFHLPLLFFFAVPNYSGSVPSNCTAPNLPPPPGISRRETPLDPNLPRFGRRGLDWFVQMAHTFLYRPPI